MINIFSWDYPPGWHVPGWHRQPTFAKALDFGQPVTFYHRIDQYCASQADVKIAFYEVRYNSTREQELKTIEQLSKSSDVIFLFHSEVYEYDFINAKTELFENAYWIIPGDHENSKQKTITWQYHIWRIVQLYQNELRFKLQDLNPYQPKEYFFSALLGATKPHREFVKQQVLSHNLENKIICKMLPTDCAEHPVQLDQSPNWWIEPGIEIIPNSPFSGSGHHCRYHGIHQISASSIMPITAYNTCAYSILAETGHENYYHMPTEKIAKMILGRQLFVAFAGKGFLQHLKDSGYQTFDGIIDESYDQIEDNQTRWEQAFEQVIALCNKDQNAVLAQARPVLEHNFSWANNFGVLGPLTAIQHILSEKEINCTIQNLNTIL